MPWHCQHEQAKEGAKHHPACLQRAHKQARLASQIASMAHIVRGSPEEQLQANDLLCLRFITRQAAGLVNRMQLFLLGTVIFYFATGLLLTIRFRFSNVPLIRFSNVPLNLEPAENCQHGAATVFPNKLEEALNLPSGTTFQKPRIAQRTSDHLLYWLLSAPRARYLSFPHTHRTSFATCLQFQAELRRCVHHAHLRTALRCFPKLYGRCPQFAENAVWQLANWRNRLQNANGSCQHV